MALTILLAKVLGLYMVIAGATLILRRNYFVPVMATFVTERLTRMLVVLFELVGGLFLVVGHNRWSSAPEGIISAIGWMAVVEALVYLLLPDALLETMFRAINKPAVYAVTGAGAILVGLYLAGFGFGWF